MKKKASEPRCIRCGMPKSSSKHIQFGNDIHNPVKHEFEANHIEAIEISREEWKKIARDHSDTIEALKGLKDWRQYVKECRALLAKIGQDGSIAATRGVAPARE